jgi:anthranilate synthase/aminodeoxychorismate synthase-like glutamine amidotransferase
MNNRLCIESHDRAAFYAALRSQNLKPFWLESPPPHSKLSRHSIIGINPKRTLTVKANKLYEHGKEIGSALELFNEFEQTAHKKTSASRFFPAWIGYFAYEYASYLGLPTHRGEKSLNPHDALFFYFEEGFVWNEAELIEQPETLTLDHLRETINAIAHTPPQIQQLKPFNEIAFKHGVEQVKERILNGVVYQANLSERFSFEPKGIDPLQVFLGLLENNPSPFMGLIEHEGWALVSGSPERLFQYSDGHLRARPIAGTRKRGATEELDTIQRQLLLSDPKELAEHSMLVDLLRNDVAAVCKPGSTHVSEAFSIERYSHVMHLVSEIQGKSSLKLLDVFRSLFPGGSITGAPKIAAMQTIADFESSMRGPYTGSLGYVSSGYGTDFNILIRSLHMNANQGVLSAGAGVVIDSDANREYDEIERKAEGLKHVLGTGKKGLKPEVPQSGSTWLPPQPPSTAKANVLFVENNDSFSHNIVDYLRTLGADVTVLYPDAPSPLPEAAEARDRRHSFSHVVVGPGPGTPHDWPNTLYWIKEAIETGTPLLGICLGHQALGLHFGAILTRGPHPVHGEAQLIEHGGTGLFRGLSSPTPLARYHSLVLNSLPSDLECTARNNEGLVMAIRHKTLPAFGVQFHPESFLSTGGLSILANFLHNVDASNANLIEMVS